MRSGRLGGKMKTHNCLQKTVISCELTNLFYHISVADTSARRKIYTFRFHADPEGAYTITAAILRDPCRGIDAVRKQKKPIQRPAQQIQHNTAAYILSMLFSGFSADSAFCSKQMPRFYWIFHLANRPPICYIIVTRGDTNVQVNPKAHGKKSNRLKAHSWKTDRTNAERASKTPFQIQGNVPTQKRISLMRYWLKFWLHGGTECISTNGRKTSNPQKARLTNDVRY